LEDFIKKKCEIDINAEEKSNEENIQKIDALQKKLDELHKKKLKNQAKSNFLQNRTPLNLTKKNDQIFLCSYKDLVNDTKQSFFQMLFLFS